MKGNELKLEASTQGVKEIVSDVPPKLPISPTPPDTSTVDSLRELVQSTKISSRSGVLSVKPQKLSEKYERIRTLKLENDGTEKDQDLKGQTLHQLFLLFYGETGVIFALTFLQGFRFRGFNLDELTLRVVVAATLGQTTAMLLIAVKHLFPEKKS